MLEQPSDIKIFDVERRAYGIDEGIGGSLRQVVCEARVFQWRDRN